jgi:hypothetical protein
MLWLSDWYKSCSSSGLQEGSNFMRREVGFEGMGREREREIISSSYCIIRSGIWRCLL